MHNALKWSDTLQKQMQHLLQDFQSISNHFGTLCIKVELSPSKKMFICINESPLKCFLFHLESSLLTFRPCRKNGLNRKIRLISKIITSEPGQQTITIHILPIIS